MVETDTGQISEQFQPDSIQEWARVGLSRKGDNLFNAMVDEFSRILLTEALSLTSGNRSQAAKLLGLSRPTLLAKIEKYGIKIETSVKRL